MYVLREKLMVILFMLFRVFPIKKNKIVVACFSGKGYGDSPKAIVEELLRRKDKYDIVWLVNDLNEDMPAQIRKVRWLSVASVYEQCTARIWIDNRRKPGYVRKRKGQYYIQTWHGVRAMKRVEMDAKESLPDAYIRAAKRDSEMADLFLSPSKFSTETYRTAFLYYGEVLDCGLPRMDVLFRNDEAQKRKIKEKYGIRPEDRVVLYAPTFRRETFKTDLSVYDIDWEGLLAGLSERLGGSWTGLLRLHPAVTKLAAKMQIPADVKDVTSYADVEEFLLISDMVVTDYSSTIIDATIAGRLGIIFAKDIEAYKKDRNFYFQLEDLPFPIATDNGELLDIVRHFDAAAQIEKQNQFFAADNFGAFTFGNATDVVVDRIESVIAG